MANEVQVTNSLQVTFPSSAPFRRQWQFTRTLAAYQGPTPGFLTATVTGVQVTLTGLTNPGVAWVQNYSDTYRLLLGIKDTSSGFFEPVIELFPLEAWPIPLARMIGSELTGGSGTGTAGSGGILWAKGVDGSVDFSVEAFGG